MFIIVYFRCSFVLFTAFFLGLPEKTLNESRKDLYFLKNLSVTQFYIMLHSTCAHLAIVWIFLIYTIFSEYICFKTRLLIIKSSVSSGIISKNVTKNGWNGKFFISCNKNNTKYDVLQSFFNMNFASYSECMWTATWIGEQQHE